MSSDSRSGGRAGANLQSPSDAHDAETENKASGDPGSGPTPSSQDGNDEKDHDHGTPQPQNGEVPLEQPGSEGSLGSDSSEILKFLMKTPVESPVPSASSSCGGCCGLCRMIGKCRGCKRPFFAYHASKEDDEHLLECDLDYPNSPPNSSWHRADQPEFSDSSSCAKRAKLG